jgi:periplasmic protein TonB
MKPQEYLNYPVLDIVFEGRNQAYGAYALRTNYDQNLRKALIISILLIFSVFAAPLIYAKIAGVKPAEAATKVVHIELMNEPIEPLKEKVKVEAPKKEIAAPTASKPTVTYITPSIVDDTENIVEAPMTAAIDITAQISTTTTNGSGGAVLPSVYNGTDAPTSFTVEAPIIDNEKEVVLVVEQQAEFQDGIQALYQWLSANMKYPAICRENGISGKTVVRFIVEKDGSITNPKIVRVSTHEALDNEALRVLKIMPHWKPGKQQGRAVRSYFTLPVKFALE